MNNHKLFLHNKFSEVSKIVSSDSTVLDIGCNNGMIRDYLKTKKYFGVDLDKKSIEKIKGEGFHAQAVDLNKEQIPFKKEKFDYILLLDIIEHVADPRNLISSSKSRLKPEGKLVITLPNDYHFLNKVRFLLNKPLTEDVFSPYGHLHFFPIKMGEHLLESLGLKIVKKIYLPPVKPVIFPQWLKNFLGKSFPQSFARDTLYVAQKVK
jgi:O-antigen biosynthesis protein